MRRLEKADYVLIVFFFSLITFPLLYVFRFLDDNSLTSWKWVFSDGRMERAFFLVLPGTVLSFFASKVRLPERFYPLFPCLLSLCVTAPLLDLPEVIVDASRYFLQAKHLELYGTEYFLREWGREIGAWTDLPVVPFFYGLIFRYLGEARLYIQAFNSLLFSLTLLLTYLIGKTLWDRETGLYAALLLLGMPYLLTQAPLMLVDVPTMFLMTFSLFAFLKALETGGPYRIALASAAVFLTIFSKYSTWLMLSVLPVAALCYESRDRRKTFCRAAMITALAGFAAGILFLAKHDIFYHQINILRTYQLSGLERWQESFLSTFLFQTHPFVSFLAVFAVFAAVKKRDGKFMIAGWFVVLVVFLQIKRIRYIVPLLPLFALMASYGLNAIADREIRRFIVFSAVTASCVLVFFGFLPFLKNTSAVNLQNAGSYLDALRCEEIEVYALPQRSSSGNTWAAIPLLDLFTSKKLIYRQGPSFSPPAEDIEKSSLRFTWELKRPPFYSGGKNGNASVTAVISDEALDKLPAELTGNRKPAGPLSVFAVSSGAFRYKTFVSVFGNDCLSGTGQ